MPSLRRFKRNERGTRLVAEQIDLLLLHSSTICRLQSQLERDEAVVVLLLLRTQSLLIRLICNHFDSNQVTVLSDDRISRQCLRQTPQP
jgi:hypothetical protein